MKYMLLIISILSFPCFAQETTYFATSKISTIIGEVDYRDKECISQIAKAENDFKANEIYFYIKPEGYLMPNATRHHPFLFQLLKEKGISFGEVFDIGIIWMIEGKDSYPTNTVCYEVAFNKLLDLKYGQDFGIRMEKKADSLYVMSRINVPFEYPNDVDCVSKLEQQGCIIYPNAKEFLDQKIQIQSDFKDSFKLPKGFLLDIQSAFRAKCVFIINRDATVSDINIALEFPNPKNAKFSDNIKKQITKFLSNANWDAATSAGITVNTHFEIVLTY